MVREESDFPYRAWNRLHDTGVSPLIADDNIFGPSKDAKQDLIADVPRCVDTGVLGSFELGKSSLKLKM